MEKVINEFKGLDNFVDMLIDEGAKAGKPFYVNLKKNKDMTQTIKLSRMAHKYKLTVKWSNKPDWNITILAIDAETITMWLPKSGSKNAETDETYIVSVKIQLLERNVERVKDNFLAKCID